MEEERPHVKYPFLSGFADGFIWLLAGCCSDPVMISCYLWELLLLMVVAEVIVEGENAHFDEVTKEELAARTKTLDVSSIRLQVC